MPATSALARAGGLIDDVVAAVDIHRFAGDQPRRIMSEKCGRRPDIVDAHQAAGGGFRLCLFKQCVDLGNAGGSARRQRAGEIA